MNYYQILNIQQNASTKEIKKHYYQLAKKYHPDKHNGNKQKCEEFKLLSEAYSTLSNPKKRYLYDLRIRFNFNEDFNLNFTDEEYELLHSYYQKIMNSTEVKFLKLLYHSLPEIIKKRAKEKFNTVIGKNRQSDELIHLQNIKYIDASKLTGDYILNLYRKFSDIYHSILKQIILIGKTKVYHLFITEYNYKIKIYDNYFITLNILGDLQRLKRKTYDLIYEQPINLYQYYYGDYYTLQIDNNEIQFKNNKDTTQKLEYLGLMNPKTGRRGHLYIVYRVDLTKNKVNQENREIIQGIFG